jgi:hypothetical protein
MLITIIGILMVPLFCIGVLCLFSDRWLPKLWMTISSTPPQATAVFRLGVWKFRALGIFYIVASLLPFISIAVPNADPLYPYIIGIACISWIASFMLGWLALSIKKKKVDSKKS